MERMTLAVEKRENAGKGVARSLRRGGFVPGVIYKDGNASSLKISTKAMLQFIEATAGEQVVVDLKYPDQSSTVALMKEYQRDPIMSELLHVDFMEVSLTEELIVSVHVIVKGEAIGVKRDKGILQHGRTEIEVSCLPHLIPGHIEIDVTNLAAGQTIHVSDLKLAEGITILTDGMEPLATVTIPVTEAAAAAPVAAEAGAAAAVAPEVAKKGKKEETKEK